MNSYFFYVLWVGGTIYTKLLTTYQVTMTFLAKLAETKLYQKLLNVFRETQVDNQEVLRLLFPLRDELPLKDCFSQAKACFMISYSKFKIPSKHNTTKKLRCLKVPYLLLISSPDHAYSSFNRTAYLGCQNGN